MKKVLARTLVFSLLLFVPAILSAQITISFDDVPDGAVIDTYYADQGFGVTFTNPVGGSVYARQSDFNTSAPNVVSIFQQGFPPTRLPSLLRKVRSRRRHLRRAPADCEHLGGGGGKS